MNYPHLMLKPYIGFCAVLNHNALIPISSSSAFVFLHGSPSFSSATPVSGSRSCTTSPPCGGTCIYMGAHEDGWIIRLAKFAVEQHNFKRVCTFCGEDFVWLQILKNFMELLAWKPVNDRLSVLGVKSGDLKLHEAVMFYMNNVRGDRFLN